jgi:hypothetical protein
LPRKTIHKLTLFPVTESLIDRGSRYLSFSNIFDKQQKHNAAMMLHGGVVIDVIPGSPGSPPGMTDSKSSKSSSFRSSINGDDDAVLADASHFEDIGLDDDVAFAPQFLQATTKSPANPYSPTFSSNLRSSSLSRASTPRLQYSRDLAHKPRPRTARPAFPSLQTHVRTINGRAVTAPAQGLGLSLPQRSPTHLHTPHSALSAQGRRSPSPNTSLRPRDPNVPIRPRRSSWQSNHARKSSFELELECDEDNGDDIPDGLILDNVPLSPRPIQERATKSVPNSKNTSPERAAKDQRVRSVGNGTPPVAAAQGSLRSPTWKSETSVPTLSTTSSAAPSPIKTRAKSWTNALQDLTPEAQDLTEKLEEHADNVEQMKTQRSSTGSMPVRRPKSADAETKPRVKSALAELPPLRRTNIMIDPLPISKEKEAVLSRTRPSWLPPKDPAEEKKHLREYQKMMAQSAEAERQREVAKRTKSECRDTAADSIMHLWEDDILPRWNDAIRERRTRDLWWRGIAPRSRGRVWRKAIGNELGLTETSFQAALGRAHAAESALRSSHTSDDDARSVALFDVIRKDVEDRTWRDLRIFQAGGPLHQALLDVLKAYAMYRSDIGYVRGLNVSAVLIHSCRNHSAGNGPS